MIINTDMTIYHVYQCTNKQNGRSYIGTTGLGLNRRFYYHCWNSFNNNSQAKFHRAIRKYGRDSWIIKSLYSCESSQKVAVVEEEMITKFDTFNNGYNGTKTGKGPNGEMPLYGSRNHMYQIGDKHPLYGKPRSEETRKRISANHVDRKGSNNTNAKHIRLQSPNGQIYDTYGGLKQFCEENNLAYSSMRYVLKQQREFTKGSVKEWKCWYV